MRLFILLFSVSCFIWAAAVDTKLYEETHREDYYSEIQKQIESYENTKLKSKEILQEEKLYFARVRSAASQEVQVEAYDFQTLSEKSISIENYYNAISAAASLRVKQKQYNKMLRAVNEKSLFSKKAIENIVEEDRPRLLTYQLKHAYYKLQEKNIEAKLQLMKAQEQEIIETLFDSIGLLNCNTVKDIDEKLQLGDKDIEKISLQTVALQIDLEKAFIEDSSKIEQIQQKIDSAQIVYQQLLSTKAIFQMEQSICMLNQNHNKLFIRKVGEIEATIEDVSGESYSLYGEQIKILEEISKKVFGSAKQFFGVSFYEGKEIVTHFKDYFTSPIFVFNQQPISLLSLLKTLVLIILGFIAGALYKRWIARIFAKWPDMSQMLVRLASNLGYYLIVVVSFIIAIASLGIDMTSISLIAGALSIGIGFGLQTVVSNFIAGIILMFERTIRIGDTIELSDALRGKVTDMRIRSTTIKTFDNIDIVVPNSSFIQNNVINWTLEDPSRRIHIPFGVAYGTEVENVKKVILDELQLSSLKYIKDDTDKEPEVWMIAMNSSRVDFELLVWVEWDSKLRPNSLKSDFLILIYNALYKHGIQIPFPQLDLHVKHMPKNEVDNNGS